MREEFKREYLKELYNEGYLFLTTDCDGMDCVFKSEPKKYSIMWHDGIDNAVSCLPFSLGLTSWDDEEPKSIAELLGIYEVDWSQIPVDTKILVSNDKVNWNKRYFAKYENGKVYTWVHGFTSWTEEKLTYWKYAKLAEE